MAEADLARDGRVSSDDAMYWALCVLREHPDLARAVAGRFDELVVDEAQDTSQLQLACLRALSDAGTLESLVLIGDLEQSICSYTGASPSGCRDLATHRGLTTMQLEENHRSSQRICDVAAKFRTGSTPDRAVGVDASCTIEPELILYPSGTPRVAVEIFRERLVGMGLSDQEASVLARRNDLVRQLNGAASRVGIAPRPLAVGTATAAIRQGGVLEWRQVDAVDRLIAYTAFGSGELVLLTPDQRWAVRHASMKLLEGAAPLDVDLRQWIEETRRSLSNVVAELTDSPARLAGQVFRSAAGHQNICAGDAFTTTRISLSAQTVHDVKGESNDAVLVVVDPTRARGRSQQGELWSRPLVGQAVSAEEAEELRIAFVAFTRARRYCAVALPDDTRADIVDAFLRSGFRFAQV